MPQDSQAHKLFFTRAGLDQGKVIGIVGDALAGADDGELFLEYRQSESVVLDDQQIKSASFDTAQGFGLRSVVGEAHGYAHGTVLSEDAIRRAAVPGKAAATAAPWPPPPRAPTRPFTPT